MGVTERFFAKVEQTPTCWLWTASRFPTGYAQFNAGPGQRTVYGHRWVYEHLVGPIPEGLVIDHLCRVRHCVNPAHMEPVTRGENVKRGEKANRTHCPRGHPYAGENLYSYVDKHGSSKRQCRACKRR